MNACMTAFAEKSGLEYKWPEEAPAEAPAGMEEAEKKDEEAPMEEGGEEAPAEGEKPAEGEAAAAEEGKKEKVSLIAADAFGDISGPENLP